MKIKVISLWQPWAWAMWMGLKKYETRSAAAPVVAQLRSYKGWLGIHAAKKPFNPGDCSELFTRILLEKYFKGPLTNLQAQMHYGCIGGVCRRN